jgi:hypothetical protein
MALQSFGGSPLFYPHGQMQTEATPSYKTMDASGEKLAVIFTIPASGTLSKVLIPIRSVSTRDTAMEVTLETVDGGSGNPTGTLIATGASGTFDSGLSMAPVECTLTTPPTVTKGDIIAVVITMSSASKNVTVGIQLAYVYFRYPYLSDYNITSAGVWTKTSTSSPVLGIYIGSTWYNANPFSPFSVYGATNTFSSPKERGILINIPFKTRLIGVAANIDAAVTEDYKFMLYSTPLTSPVAECTGENVDAHLRSATGASNGVLYFFASPFILQPNTDYVLCVQATTENAIALSGLKSYPEYSALTWDGKNKLGYYRDTLSTTVFTQDTGTQFQLVAILDQYDDGAGSGGGGGHVLGRSGVR